MLVDFEDSGFMGDPPPMKMPVGYASLSEVSIILPTNSCHLLLEAGDTGGEGTWKPVITCWVHLELMCIFLTM